LSFQMHLYMLLRKFIHANLVVKLFPNCSKFQNFMARVSMQTPALQRLLNVIKRRKMPSIYFSKKRCLRDFRLAVSSWRLAVHCRLAVCTVLAPDGRCAQTFLRFSTSRIGNFHRGTYSRKLCSVTN
jgi:hypothetical protein